MGSTVRATWKWRGRLLPSYYMAFMICSDTPKRSIAFLINDVYLAFMIHALLWRPGSSTGGECGWARHNTMRALVLRCKAFVDTPYHKVTVGLFMLLTSSWFYFRLYTFPSAALFPIFKAIKTRPNHSETEGSSYFIFILLTLSLMNIYWYACTPRELNKWGGSYILCFGHLGIIYCLCVPLQVCVDGEDVCPLHCQWSNERSALAGF